MEHYNIQISIVSWYVCLQTLESSSPLSPSAILQRNPPPPQQHPKNCNVQSLEPWNTDYSPKPSQNTLELSQSPCKILIEPS